MKRAHVAAALAAAIMTAAPTTAEPTKDFAVFWPQVRQAFLEADPEALAALSYTGGLVFRYDIVDVGKACERDAAEAYLKALLDAPARRSTTWGEFLRDHPELDLNGDSAVTVNGGGEYSVHLKVRFAASGPDGTWQITDMLTDLDRFFAFSQSAGGPASCS